MTILLLQKKQVINNFTVNTKKIPSPAEGIFFTLPGHHIPTALKEQLLDTWQINQRMNLLLINNTSDAGMQKTLSTRGGRTIFQQWIHIHQVRMQWLEIGAKDILANRKMPDKNIAADQKSLVQALNESADAISQLLSRSWDEGGKIKGFKKGLIPLLGYLISHESHHRGNMLLTLKQAGEKIPDTIKWELWEWGK